MAPFLIIVLIIVELAAHFFGLSDVEKWPLLSHAIGIAQTLGAGVGIYLFGGVHIVNEWERLPVLLFGKYVRTAGPGFVWIDPIFHEVYDAVLTNDVVRTVTVEQLLSKDNVPLGLTFAITTHLGADNVKDYTVNVDDADEAIDSRAIATITEIAAGKDLNDILHNSAAFATAVVSALQTKVATWGMTIIAVEILDLAIKNAGIEEAMTMKARAQREGEAEVARASLQLQVAESLQAAAKIYTDPTAKWLRGLETLAELGRSANNNTIMVPTDLVGMLGQLNQK